MAVYHSVNPGDIVVIIRTNPQANTDSTVDTVNGAATTAEAIPGLEIIPIETLELNYTIEQEPKYGTGYHGPICIVQGKQAYKGSFVIGTYWAGDRANPETWENLIKNHLQYTDDQMLSREFQIEMHGRAAAEGAETGLLNGTNGGVILTVNRCLLEGSDVSVPTGSGSISRKYAFSAYSITWSG